MLCIEPLRYSAELRERIAVFADADYLDAPTHAALVEALQRAPYQALLVRLGVAIDDAVLAATPALRVVATPTTGLDHIDLDACARRGVLVVSLKSETAFLDSIKSTAEHTWALLLALSRHLPAAAADVSAGHWRREPFLADELDGKTLGVVGCGRLGRMVASYGLAFGMAVLVHDADPDALARVPAGARVVDTDAVLAQSDVVSLHLPLDEKTQGWLSAERIARMKHGAWLVNTARGELVDEPALLVAIGSGAIGAFAADVLAGDSTWEHGVPTEHPLVEAARAGRRVILTPHMGGYGRQAIQNTRRFIIERVAEQMG
jgi:D-3-phosphoglycerate dehydrogenase